MLPSLLHLECVTVHGSDLEDAKSNPIKQVEAETVDTAVAYSEFFEDEEALVLARVDARIERALEGVTHQWLDASGVRETFIHRRIASDELGANEHFGKREELFISTAVDEQFANRGWVNRHGTSGAKGHLTVADSKTSTRLLSNDEGEARFLSSLIAVHAQGVADTGENQPLGTGGKAGRSRC